MFGSLGNIASLLKNAPELMRQMREMQGRAEDIKEQLAKVRVEGSAGGGMVRVEASGQMKIVAVSIEQSLIDDGDRELLEDLLVAATNQAVERAREAFSTEMGKLAGGLELPGMNEMLSRFGMSPPADADDEPPAAPAGGSIVV